VELDDLPPRAVIMLDLLWECKSIQQLHVFRNSLGLHDRRLCDTLIQLVQMANAEQEIEEMNGNYPEARDVIMRARNM
jgi:hypothetical protein